MSLTSLLTILGSVVATALAQVCMKLASTSFSGSRQDPGYSLAVSLFHQILHPLSLLAIAAYGLSLVLWLLALRDVPLSVAYPFAGLTLALVAVLGVSILDEPLTTSKIVGVTTIVLGVIVLARQ